MPNDDEGIVRPSNIRSKPRETPMVAYLYQLSGHAVLHFASSNHAWHESSCNTVPRDVRIGICLVIAEAAACEKINATPRQMLQSASPATASSRNAALSVSTTRDEVLNALKSNMKVADDFNKLSLSSGCTVPVDTERVLKQAALNCAEVYFDDEEKQGLLMLAATMAEFSISS